MNILKRKYINYESLIAQALLYFKKLDSYDINLLIKMIKKDEEYTYVDSSLKDIDNLLFVGDKEIKLKDGYNFETKINGVLNSYKVKDKLENESNEFAREFFKKLKLDYFVMKKILLIENVSIGFIKSTFNDIEIKEIEKLLNLGYLRINFNDNIFYTDLQEISISKYGTLTMFIKENENLYNAFLKEIIDKNYELTNINDYFLSYSKLSLEIFSIDNYEKYLNRKIKYVDTKENNIEYESIKTNYSNIVCSLGNSKLKRPLGTKPCNCKFEIDENKIFALKKGLFDRYYMLCPNCGFIVKIPSESISSETINKLHLRRENDLTLYNKKCEESKQINEGYYGKQFKK